MRACVYDRHEQETGVESEARTHEASAAGQQGVAGGDARQGGENKSRCPGGSGRVDVT